MSIIIERFDKIKSNIASVKSTKTINIIAVSKTFTLSHIRPLLDHGHIHFGENKVQEAVSKWSEIKKINEVRYTFLFYYKIHCIILYKLLNLFQFNYFRSYFLSLILVHHYHLN